MELYLSACSKAANVAAAKTANSRLAADSQQCGDGTHKTHFLGVGAAQLLDLPLGVKLPVIPGGNTLYYTTKLSEKLFRPSYGFNLTDPYCRLLENQYKSLHDPHLRAYHKRKDILRRLKKGGYVTSNNKIVCTLRELNKYRQYLTSLKLDFERNYIREQKMLAKQVNKLQEDNQIPGRSDVAQFQNWLLQEGSLSVKDQERLIRHRYLDMISKELEHLAHTAEEQRLLQMDREERRQREHARRKLSLRRKIEEEWKTKEMLLLTRIGEDIKREARIEEQRRKSREESDRKKQALLEKKMAYHLQKMQESGIKKEDMRKNAIDYREHDGPHYESYSPKKKKKNNDDIKLVYPVGDQKANKGAYGPFVSTIHPSLSSSKNVAKKSVPSVCQPDVQNNDTEQKKDGETNKKSSIFADKGEIHVSAQNSILSAQNSATRNFPRSSHSYVGPSKDEKKINADWHERSKRPNYSCESGPQAPATAQGVFPSCVFSNTQQNLLQNCLQEKVTSEELNSIIQNIMTWVVATVTSILYPAITKYEERLKNNAYPVSDDSILSSDSSSFCSTCSEEFTCGSYTSATTKTFHGEPCAFAVDISVRRPTTPLKPPSACVERTVVGKTYHIKGQSITSELEYNKTSMIYTYPKLRSCKSDSHLLASFETGTKKSKDATTETDGLESPLFTDQKAKAMNEMKSLKNVFVNFKCHLKGETELILESIFQEIMSDLTQAIPSISSVTAEVFVDQSEPEKGDLVSNADICSVASEIVENMLEKLQSAVEKKCVQIFSQEDLSVNIKPSLPPSGESLTPSYGKPLIASLPHPVEPICDLAEDMVHAILEKLMTLASYKQNELPHLEDATELSYQQHMTDLTYMRLIKANKKKCSPKLDAANLIVKEEIQNLMSNIFSQSSLVGYIEEAISTILGYIQTELNNERLIASEETVVLLKLLDDLFTQLHQEPVKADNQKCRHSRLRSPSDTEVKYRLTGTRLSNGPRSGRPFLPINVPGMVLYSEDDSEEIDKIVENVLDSSFKDEKAKSQEQIPEHWFTKGNTCLEYKRNSKQPTKPASPRSKVAFHDRRLKAELPFFKNKKILNEKPCLNKDILFFSQDQKHQIQKASENIVKSILTEMLKDVSSVPPGHLDSKTGKEASVLVSKKIQGLSHQEQMDQMFSVSEISAVAQEITDAVLNILHKASCIPSTTKSSISSAVHQTSLESPDTPHMVKEVPNKKPLKIWFHSEKKMKYLSSLDVDPAKPSLLKSEESEPKPVDDVTDKIINAVFKRLKLFVYPKLQMGFKPSLAEQSSLQSQLTTYTAKVVNIVLHAIQNELELNKKNLNLRETDHTKSLTGKGFFTDTDKLESPVSNLNDDIMASPLLTCICEILSSGHSDQSSISLPSDNPKPTTSYRSDNIDKGNILPSRQDKKSFYKFLALPCALHSVINEKDLKENSRLQVLDNIGEILCEMLCKLIGAHPYCQPSCSKLSREKMNENQQTATDLQSNIQLISTTILEYILAKLCSVDTDTSSISSGFKDVSESLDIDSLSFTSIIEEMAKCTDIISSIVSRMVQKGSKEMTKSKEKPIVLKSSKTGSTEEMHSKKLKAVASDILNMVFAKLEGFVNGNLETLGGSINDGNKKSSKMNLECESPSVFMDTHEELLQSALYMHAKKVSSAILKAVQTELNMNSLDLRTSMETPPPEKQTLENIVSLILDAVSSDMLNETESEERGIENYRYRPTYGNFLPGGAESDSFLEDVANTEKEFTGERISQGEETKSDSLQQWVLERTLNKIEVKLKEPQKSPVVPIIRNILNEIFQSALVSQLNLLSLSHSHLSGIPHNVDEPIAQTSVQFIDKTMVSETEVITVAHDVVRTVFDKLYSAAITERNASENRYKTITFSANVSFHEHTYGEGKPTITVTNKNPYTLQSRFSVDKQAKVSIVEDIVQAILTSLKTFATSKVQSLFCPQINFTVPIALPIQQDKESTLSKTLPAKDLHSDDQFSCCSVDHMMSEKTNSLRQVSLNKLNTYATEVARKILQGIKHELDKERESSFLTHNTVVSESIASHIINMVLDIISSKGKCDKNNSDKEINSDQQEGIIEKMFNKTEYRKVLQFQIQDTIESILCDIYEKTLYQNNLSFAIPTFKCSIAGKHSRANSEMFIDGANKILPKFSVPKSDVILISSDIVDTVLHNLSSSVILSINPRDPTSTRLPLSFRDMFPKVEGKQPLLMESKSERKTEYFPSSENLKLAYASDSQITVIEREDPKKSIPDPCEESADFISKTIFNRLESFATERIDLLITLAFQPKEKSFLSPELENCKQDDSIFHESSQVESNVNILKISNETILSQELTDSTFASYREKYGSTIHLSQASLKEYADIIASAILKLVKNDLDLEIQKMHPYPNNISFQEITTVSETVNSILKILCNKRSGKEISFYSKDNLNLFSQVTASNEVSLGQRAQEKHTKLSLFSKYPLEQNQMALERESQRNVLEEIFMRNEESKQKERAALFSAVEEVLSKVYQRIMEIIGHLPSFNEIPHSVSNSKTSDITQRNFFQSHISSVASDIIESVLGKMYSVVVTSLYESNRVAADKNILPRKSSCIRETTQAGIGSNPTSYVLPQVYLYAGSRNVSQLENTFLQYSPLQVGKDLVQMVLNKITNFASLYLEETLSKVSPKGSPKPSFKTNLKARSKVTPLPKFRTKPHLGPRHSKTKSKTKLGTGEKSPKNNWSRTASGLPDILSTGDAKNLLEMKLPTSELKMYAKDIISNILKTIVKEFEKVTQIRAMVNDKALPSDQIMAANKIVNTVLQGLYATNNHNLTNPIKFSHLDDPKLSQGNIGAESLAKPQACFYLENVSSQLEQIFPKEGIFKKLFDKWQAESNDMENEKCKLLMIAENGLTEISIKAKELEHSLSLLNLPHLEDSENRFHSCFKGASARAEDTKAQINMFGREIVEMLFEKLQLCFLSQMPTPRGKETPASRKEHITTKTKYGFPTKDILSNVPICNTKTKDQSSLGSSNQIFREIVERVLNMLESFVDLQFKHISKYEFSEIVKMPVENLFPVQPRLLSKKMLPKVQPLKKFSNESKSSTVISKENVQNTLLQFHSFHSELLTYAVNIISDMLGIIKSKLDKEISQAEPSSVSILKENVAASEIIGTLMDQCPHFHKSLIKNLPKQSLFQGVENTYIVNQVELATNMKMPMSKLKEVSFQNNPPQSGVSGLGFYSEEDKKKRYKPSSNLPSYSRASAEDTIRSSEPMEGPDSENIPSCSRNKVQDFSPEESYLGYFDQAIKGNSSLPEGSVLQKLLKKANESTETALKQVMSFIEMRKGENPRVFHYEISKTVVEPNQIHTTVSPLKICLAAENIVSTVLSSYGFPSQPHINESTETMKPFFISKQNPLSVIAGGQKNEEKNLLRMWDKRISCIPEEEEEEEERPEASREDFSLLQKWENKSYVKIKTLKEVEVIAFADHELGPNEIHLVARHVTTSVVTYLKNFETRVSSEEVSVVSTLSRKKYQSKQPLRSIYNDSSLYQLCEHLTECVICHLISNISDSTTESREKEKAWERQNAALNRIISIDSQVFKSRSISVGELALSISEIITEILLNSNIIETDIVQQMFSLKRKYIYCPGVAAADFDELFQDLLIGVIHVLSKEIGLNHHLEHSERNRPFSMLRSNSVPICNKKNTMQRHKASRDWIQTDHIIQKNKLNYLACKLDSLTDSLKTHESKEVVNKVFSIVLELFLPDEQPVEAMDSDKKAGTFFASSNDWQCNHILGNNLGLTPKSVFLLNVVCEKLIRTLLEKCTNSLFFDNSPLSEEISAEECQLLKILQSVDDEEFDYCKGMMDCEQFQGDYMSDILENLAEMDQDLLSSDSMLTIISHSLVKSLMDKLCHGIQLPQSPPFANKQLTCGTREIQSSFIKAKRPELTELGQAKDSLGLMSYDGSALTGPLNNPSVVNSKIQAPFGKKYSVNFTNVSPFKRQGTKDMDTIAIHNKLYPGDMNTGVYSATFLEDIISELFFNLSISLWGKNENITEAQLSEMNALFVSNVVNEFNKARVTVLRNSEERLCFPPIHKETVSRIVDSVYYDVLQQYKLKVTCGGNLACDSTSIAEQITNSILLEILDYQLSSCFRGKLLYNSYYPLNAEIILQKLQNNLREFTSQPRSSAGYSTMLSHSFLEDIIRRLLSQLIAPPSKASSLGKKYFMSSYFNEMSTCIINKVISAISKHKIWFTIYDNQYLCTGKNLQKMVDSVYRNIMQTSDSLLSIQKSVVSRSPIMVDRIASFIIQEIIENHLQPFLCGEGLPRPKTPSDAVSNMVKQVISEVIESHRPQMPSPSGIYPETFVGKIVARLLSKIFSPKHNTKIEMENMTQKIVKSVNNHFDKAKVHILYDDKEQSYPSVDTDIVDELVTSVYRNVLKQHGLDPEADKESEDSDTFVEKITNLVVAAISDYLLHPLFSGDFPSSSYSISTAENIVQDVLGNISRSPKPSQSLSPYNTLLPYTFLEDMIRVLLSKIFPSASSIVANRGNPKDRSKLNFNEVASNIISDIRMKISQHEIRFSKDEEETKFVYSEDDIQHLVDSVFKNISNSESQGSVEQNITSSNDVLIDRIAGFIIKHICQQHLQPFVDGKSLPSSSYIYFDDERRQWFYASVYSSTFLEDVISGILSKIFHRVLGIVQTKSVTDSGDELFDKAEKLIHFITEEFSKAQVSILENAEENLCLPPVERDVVKNIIDRVYSKVVQEYEMDIMPDKDFLNDTKTLAARITKTILVETSDFQIHPDLIEKLPFGPQPKLSTDILIKKVQCDIIKSRFQRQASALYTTMLSHTHLEKIVFQLISQMSPLASRTEHPNTSQSDLSNTVIKVINEIMSIISKHAICITKHGNEKHSMISEKDIQSMVDSIYADLSYSNIYQSLTKDKKGISNIPVSKIASFIIKEIFNHHLQSFLSRDKTLVSAAVDQTYKQKAVDPKQKELSFIVNSAVFFEEVISELLCKLLYAFSHNVLAAQNPDTVKAEVTGIVTTLVNSIVLEFTTSEVLVAGNFDDDICFLEGYKEMVQKTVNLIYEKILDEYKSLIQIYRAIQNDTACFGRKIYNLLLEEIYDYQVQSLVSGKLVSSSYSSPQPDKIIRNVLSVIVRDSHALPSCITVLPRSLLEDMIYKLLVHIFPSADTESELKEEEVSPDYEFVDTASKLTDEIIKEISEHEIRLATAEENAESMQLEVIENLVDSICNNIWKKSEFQAEVQKDEDEKGGSFLSKIAAFIMKAIMDHHLQPFLHGEEPSPSNLSNYDHVSVHTKPSKEKRQPSLYSATFLEDVIVDLVRKFYSLPSITEGSKKKETPEPDIVSLAIKFANSLIGEFRKSEIKVLPNAEEMFSFPPVDKETVDKISNFVYDQFIGKYGCNDVQKDDKNNIVIEIIAALAQKAISAFKIQPLFSGDWSSTFFSFLNPDNITQRVKHLPQKTSTQINRCVKGNQLTLPEQSYKHTSLISDQKNLLDTLEINRDAVSKKKSFKTEETSMRKGDIQDPIVTSVTRIMKSNMVNLLSGSAAVVANKKKENEKEMVIPIQKYNVSKVTSPVTSVRTKDTQEPYLKGTLKNNEIEKSLSASDKEGQANEVRTQFPVVTDGTECEKEILGPDFAIDSEKIDKTRENSLKKEDKPFQLSSLISKAKNTETTIEKTLKSVARKPNNEREDSPAQIDIKEGQYSDYECVQNVIENIYDNILGIYHSQESADYSKQQSLPSYTALPLVQEVGKDFAQSVSRKDLSLSINKNLPAKEKEEKEKEKAREDIKKEPSKPDSPQYPAKSEPGIFPAKFLEDVITEMVNRLVFSSSPKTQTYDTCQNVSDDENQAELYDTAMRLIDLLLEEFSNAQIKVFRPDKENQFFLPVDKVSSVPKGPPRHKESNIDKAPSNTKKITVDNMHKTTEKPSSNKILDKISIDKTLVNKVVHSSVCNILKEYRSQDSICENIKSNGEILARRLTSAVINEIFQHKLNLILCDEVPASSCLPLETKDVIKKVQKVAQTASKECQTSSPYTIMLPHEFLENVISALVSKIFSTVSNTKAGTSEGNWFTELDFLQMKLLSTVTTEISKVEDMIIQYVESLHPNDNEIIQLVVQSLYNNLLSQFGSQEIIQNCAASGCRILSETIVDLILREVTGNQLQNYFSGELTPYQCAEVDSVVENILKDVIQTADVPQTQPSHACILPYNIIEEIAVKFLSKLLSMFPKDTERPKSQETEMQKVTSKILNSIQEFISKSNMKVVSPAKELPTVPLADNETIEKVVNSVYASILKHSGSHTSIFKDLLGKSNVLSDIIGFLMVKEISNSKFQPQVKEELSSSELALEAVKIMEKVVKMVDEFKSQEKSSSKKGSVLDAKFLEEALALFLAKIIRLPSASSKHAKNLSKPELNKIASQLTKSVTAEISKSNINLAAADTEEHFLNPESIEMISQVIDSIYSNVLQQSGTHKDLYYDIKSTNRVFPKKVASLIINEVSNFPLDIVSPKNSDASLFGDLDINRIVQKAQEHAKMIPDLDKEKSNKDSIVEDSTIKIVPYVGNKPLKIDPNIISEHLAVISVKTQPLERLKMECLKNTGHSIAELRRASLSGRSYSSDTSAVGQLKRERRTSLNKMGRLDVKPFEAVCRNSFQNIRKPDITKVELLKDVQNKKELILRLVAHDIDQEVSESTIEEEFMFDENEIVLREIVQEEHLGEQVEDQVKEATKPVETKVVSPKPTRSTSSLKKFFSLSKYYQPTSNANVENTEATSNHVTEPKEGQVKRTLAELDMVTYTRTLTETDTVWEEKPQRKKEEKILITEPTHYFIHRIMSSSSYNQEDLISYAGETEDCTADRSSKILEASSQEQKPENSNSVKFITIFEGNKNILGSVNPSKEVISETPKPSIPKQRSKMLAKVSSALSKVFSRTNTSISKSSSPPYQDEV
ncbi:fibrous sheath-interacting protein 2 [Hippopotamus amphibius kiboko]|uniref:fibrous sheath-interacting protein 2 n=1 Tax=Hippopotamus amphibius kiboko TaxID=575201 RepID=UPI002591D89C|nr:fibrous sheath-interacting protein 2 [Hippopotamus amphibius kiboko]